MRYWFGGIAHSQEQVVDVPIIATVDECLAGHIGGMREMVWRGSVQDGGVTNATGEQIVDERRALRIVVETELGGKHVCS